MNTKLFLFFNREYFFLLSVKEFTIFLINLLIVSVLKLHLFGMLKKMYFGFSFA